MHHASDQTAMMYPFVVLAQLLLFRRGMPMHLIARRLYIREPGEAPAAIAGSVVQNPA